MENITDKERELLDCILELVGIFVNNELTTMETILLRCVLGHSLEHNREAQSAVAEILDEYN